MNTGLHEELEAALKAMEASFHVRLIGTFDPDLVTAPVDADATTWLADHYPEFDQFPVKQHGNTVGVLLRQSNNIGKSVIDAMHPLREGNIISADMPIADLIPQLREHHYRLVLRGNRIDGLVTQSDLVKLPVRMMLFGFITHLEMCLRALIRQRMVWPNWSLKLDPAPRKQIEKNLRIFKKSRFEPDPLEFTMFNDVICVLSDEPDLGADFGADMDRIRKLRNELAHAKTFVSSSVDLRDFVDCFEALRQWIGQITNILKKSA